MNRIDTAFQIVLAIVALTALNRLVYQDSMLVSIGCAVAVTACFWLGRLSVRLYRYRAARRLRRIADE